MQFNKTIEKLHRSPRTIIVQWTMTLKEMILLEDDQLHPIHWTMIVERVLENATSLYALWMARNSASNCCTSSSSVILTWMKISTYKALNFSGIRWSTIGSTSWSPVVTCRIPPIWILNHVRPHMVLPTFPGSTDSTKISWQPMFNRSPGCQFCREPR